MALPSDDTDDAPVSLSQPAPAGPIPTTAWHAYFSYGIGHLDYNGLVEQRNPCTRSLRHQWNVKSQFFLQPPAAQGMPQLSSNYEINETATFPYPKAYQELMDPIQRHDEEHGTVDGETSPTRQAQAERIEWKTTISTPVFGIERTSAIEFESRIQPTYVVLGLFLRGNPNPKERVVFVDKPDQLFSKLRWATFRLRGMRGTLLSLKHLKGFRIYKCDADTGTHKHINLDDNGVADLQLFMSTYRRWHVPRYISLAWSDWIHCTLNNKRLDILEGQYGLELVLDWSVTRISIVVLIPVLLSLAIGIWLNSKAWTDLATIQTAWGTASYIVTAGAYIIKSSSMDAFPHMSSRQKIRSSDDVSAYEPFNTSQEHRGLGNPIQRRLCDLSEIAALILSFCCSIVGIICCFHPATAVSLEQKYQLIVVGLMLSLMDLCTARLSTIVFLQLETRWASLLQNYDSIIKKSILGSLLNGRRGSQRWTLLLPASLAFPLLLSVGYKSFVGGKVTTQVHASGGQYGLTGPIGFANFASGASLMVNATIPFMFTNSYTVSANVFGLAWHLDQEADKQRDNDTWWNQRFDSSDDDAPQNISLYKEKKWLSTLWPQDQVDQFFVLLTPHVGQSKELWNIKPSKARFQKEALELTSQRLKCTGKWKITANSVNLIEGSCAGSFVKAFPKSRSTLHLNDARYLLSDFVSDLLTDNLNEAAPTRFAAVVSSLFWSRLAAFCDIGSAVNDLKAGEREQFEYDRPDKAWKTVTVLKRSPLLAIVLLAQPIVGLILLIIRNAFCSSPVSGGFGLISVLSGHMFDERDILSGVGLSGDVKERIELAVDGCGDRYGGRGERVRFRLKEARNSMHHDRMELRPGVSYH
ncbi:uncharacterized protein FTJAE_12827 [Fusarium tjaetaba]|uniref:Uncharacterized protein n=1 Tax=Fusarium tjaetaba TaxID=1567544 RepID=A0A8H5VA88_9HYPO|nr:uncharacterized protein FTJAE_12827 [Fusarium tjaetaba]KAF5616952.1 hypothetical protein FTJAE_12827 [Fusarium tjaetaba]